MLCACLELECHNINSIIGRNLTQTNLLATSYFQAVFPIACIKKTSLKWPFQKCGFMFHLWRLLLGISSLVNMIIGILVLYSVHVDLIVEMA